MNKNSLIKNLLLIVIFIILMYFVFQFFSKVEIEEQGASVFQMLEEQNNGLNDNSSQMQKKVDIEILKEGEGESSKVGDSLVVHYTGTLENGEKFDSSLDRGEPFEFTLGNHSVIEGWEQGMLNMKIGEKRKLFIPYELAYGESGYPPIIPEKANLVFEVELLEIK